MKGSETIYGAVTYDFTPEISVDIEYEADINWEKTEGSFSKRAETPDDYYGIDDVDVTGFVITKAYLIVEGDELREWDEAYDEDFLKSFSDNEDIIDLIHVSAEECYRNDN